MIELMKTNVIYIERIGWDHKKVKLITFLMEREKFANNNIIDWKITSCGRENSAKMEI